MCQRDWVRQEAGRWNLRAEEAEVARWVWGCGGCRGTGPGEMVGELGVYLGFCMADRAGSGQGEEGRGVFVYRHVLLECVRIYETSFVI